MQMLRKSFIDPEAVEAEDGTSTTEATIAGESTPGTIVPENVLASDSASGAPEPSEEGKSIDSKAGPEPTTLSREEIVELFTPKRKGPGRKSLDELEARDVSVEGMFVNLTDLLPPLPKKGEFDVNKIKSSLYFFS